MAVLSRVWGGLLFAVLGLGPALAEECPPARTFLVIHSYAPDYSWTRAENDGIAHAFSRIACPPHVRIEYLDSKYVQASAYFDELAQILASKYRGARIDGVITTDNTAYGFVQTHGREIFGDAPTVSGGINGYDDAAPRPPVVTVLPEVADHFGTLAQALAQNPKATDVYVVADSTVTGAAISREIRDDAALTHLPLKLHFSYNFV